MTDKLPIINEPLLDEFRHTLHCEWCGLYTGLLMQPHHIWKRQMGGGARIDWRINLIALCAGWGSSWCHRKADEGLIPRAELLKIVAHREARAVEQIEHDINGLLWGRR